MTRRLTAWPDTGTPLGRVSRVSNFLLFKPIHPLGATVLPITKYSSYYLATSSLLSELMHLSLNL